MDFKEIRYVDDSTKSIESINDPNDYITLWKDLEYFDDGTKYTKFIKQCEQGVRRSKEYKAFINYIKNILGFDFCMVSSHIILSLLLFESGLLDFLPDIVSPPELQVPMGAVEALVAPNS